MLDGGTLRYTGLTAATNRGFTSAGNTNSTIDVAGTGVALTMGACTIAHTPPFANNPQALTFIGGAGSSLTVGQVTATPAAFQVNLVPNLPTTFGSVTYAHTAGQFVLANRGTSTFTCGDVTGPGAAQDFFLGGPGTYTGVFSGFTGRLIIGAGGQTMRLLGLSTFPGIVEIRQGATVVEFNSIKNADGTPSALGAPTTAANGTIRAGQAGNAHRLKYTGTGDTTDRVLSLFGTTGNVTLEQAGTGLLKFTSALTSGAGSKTLILTGSTAGTGELGGAIVNNSPTFTTSVTKDGTGTWTLSGINTYTGATAVNAGTLALVGGSQTSAITVAANASLGFTAGSPTTSTAAVTFAASSSVTVTGPFGPSDYQLMTATSITGPLTLSPAIPNYSLENRSGGTELWLKYTPPASPFLAWSGGPGPNTDTNLDGLNNSAAWVVGAANVNASATGLVPTLDNTSDADFLIFNYRRLDTAAADPATTIKVQYNSNLTGWTDAVAGADIIITPSNDFHGPGIDKVEVKIRRTLAVGGRIFARLNVTVTIP